METLEDLKAKAAKAKARREAARLSPDEQERARLRRETETDLAQARADEKVRRGERAEKLEAEARVEAAGKYLVKALDVYDCFPDGVSPDPEDLPGGGVLIVRGASGEAYDAVMAEFRTKERTPEEVMSDLFAGNVVRPNISGESLDATKFAVMCGLYKGVRTQGGNLAFELAGLKLTADKRGRG